MTLSLQKTVTITPPQIELKYAIFGGVAAGISTLTVQPLEVIKTRLIQTGSIELSKIRSVSKEIIQTGGIFSFWRGTAPSLFRVLPGAGLYFLTIESLTYHRKKTLLSETLPAHELICIGAFARSLMTTLFLPLTIIKTRFESSSFTYRSTYSAIKDIIKREGAGGFTHGLLPTLLRDAPFSGLYYLFYIKSKLFIENLNEKGIFSVNQYIIPALCGTSSGLIATAITHPPDVIRTQIQILNENTKKTTWQITNEIISSKGLTGLYRGLSLRLLRRPLMTAITWTCYEMFKKFSF